MNVGQGDKRDAGPLTAITAVRVEGLVEQFEVESLRWADRMQDPDPAPVAAFIGSLGDFDPDRQTGLGKTVHALRVLPADEALVEQIRAQAEAAFVGNYIVVSAAAPHTFRIIARTIHEAGRSQQATLVLLEILQAVRLPRVPGRELPAVIWAIEPMSWIEVGHPGWPVLDVGIALLLFLRAFHRQQPPSSCAGSPARGARLPGSTPVTVADLGSNRQPMHGGEGLGYPDAGYGSGWVQR